MVGTCRLPDRVDSLGQSLLAKTKESVHLQRSLQVESFVGRLKLTRLRQTQQVPLSDALALL